MLFQTYQVGQVFECGSFSLTKEEIIEFAEKFDCLFLHTNEEEAKNTFYRGIIASGLHTTTMVWNQFVKTGVPGQDFLGGKKSEVEYVLPLYANEVIGVTVTITSKKEAPHGKFGEVDFCFEAKKADGKTLLKGTNKAIVSCLALATSR